MWIGYQSIYAAGQGLAVQQPLIAVQTALNMDDIPEGTAIINFLQTFGGTAFTAAAQAIFSGRLVSAIAASGIPIPSDAVLSQGATRLAALVPPAFLGALRQAYNSALTGTFAMGLACSGVAFLMGIGIPWLSTRAVHHVYDTENRASGDDRASESSSAQDVSLVLALPTIKRPPSAPVHLSTLFPDNAPTTEETKDEDHPQTGLESSPKKRKRTSLQHSLSTTTLDRQREAELQRYRSLLLQQRRKARDAYLRALEQESRLLDIESSLYDPGTSSRVRDRF
ncbi:hypothetical protein CAC42_6851 [Sphaceloma murrayae]|uniref:Uncharacterized protein n=1 Tax=Sphaceloma murrayae TaxID=2082308 RepID=A0A2K1QGM9_9PEZI|nr:hypothetical protein CAC42_6851 [Sphaceloma murrayae]